MPWAPNRPKSSQQWIRITNALPKARSCFRVTGLRNSPRLPLPRPLSRLSLVAPDPIRLGPSLSPVDPFSVRLAHPPWPVIATLSPKIRRSYNTDAAARNTKTAPGTSELASATTPEVAQESTSNNSTFLGLTLGFPQLKKDSALLRPNPPVTKTSEIRSNAPPCRAVHQLFARLHRLLGDLA
ncbi:hypothetical protein CNYM01_13057 [Colletotrichum nymphaeae SA-01]|uniref:Uncharacterized protein n=1 Tax=Colletotrichum nymphaeae SA-01 TaxID=1460502 RepID=A0A135T9Z2_9PEZI|nr:hypothetical protein CNYM01_13057 [Colletotrichum nymphaeae SA-01]